MLMCVNVEGGRLPGADTCIVLPPGKPLRKTKESERFRALRLTPTAWNTLQDHSKKKEGLDPEVQRRIEREKYLKETAKAMIKNWKGTADAIHKRKEEERERKKIEAREKPLQRYLELRKEQEEIKEKYIAEKLKELYRSEGKAKDIDSAYVFSELLFEREKQIEMKNMLKNHENEVDAEWARKIKQGAIDEAREKIEEAQIDKQKKAKTRRILLEQIKENTDKRVSEENERIKQEIEDNLARERENQQILRFEAEDEHKRTEDVKADFEKFVARQRLHKEKRKQEEEQLNAVIETYAKGKCRIEHLRKKKEEEILAQKRKNAELIAQKVMAATQAKGDDAERVLREALEEAERREKEKERAKQEHNQRMVREARENREKILKQEQERMFEENERNKWTMLNRCRMQDVIKEKTLEKRKEEWGAKLRYRHDLLKQMAEHVDEEKLETDAILKERIEEYKKADEKFFNYANEVMEEAKSRKGRNLHPIQRVILEYKTENGLIPTLRQRKCEEAKKRLSKELVNFKPGRMAHKPVIEPKCSRRIKCPRDLFCT